MGSTCRRHPRDLRKLATPSMHTLYESREQRTNYKRQADREMLQPRPEISTTSSCRACSRIDCSIHSFPVRSSGRPVPPTLIRRRRCSSSFLLRSAPSIGLLTFGAQNGQPRTGNSAAPVTAGVTTPPHRSIPAAHDPMRVWAPEPKATRRFETGRVALAVSRRVVAPKETPRPCRASSPRQSWMMPQFLLRQNKPTSSWVFRIDGKGAGNAIEGSNMCLRQLR